MSVPTASDINVYDSLDERSACMHFLGKSLAEAEGLFRDNALYYQEDLMFMGPVAFRFYVPAFISYIRSNHSTGDSDAVSCFQGLIQFWVDHYGPEVTPVAGMLASACQYILDSYQKFEIPTEIYGDLRERIVSLLSQLRPSAAG
jgi:hypothetical protein